MPHVESSYLNADMSEFESSQKMKAEPKWADSSKAYSKPIELLIIKFL